jgi:hypothetical protein
MKTELADGRALFTKPCIMKKLINTYLPEGPMMLDGILQELNQTTYEPVEIFNDN